MTPQRKAKLIVVLNTITLIGGVVTIFLLLRIISNAAHQTTTTNSSIAASQKVTEKELRCLASFFSQTNRQTIRINNLETCQILHTDTGQVEDLPLTPTPVSNSSTSPAVPSSDTKQNSTTNPTPIQSNTPQTSASQNTAPSQIAPQVQAQGEQQLQQAGNPQPAAKELFGIPICIPFTGVCVR